MTDLSLFAVPESMEVPPGEHARTTTVREHTRRVEPRARRSDPETSWSAATLVSKTAGANRTAVLLALAEQPMTDFELAERMGRQQTSVGVRRGELAKQGLVESSGEKRPAPSGAMALVWQVTALGEAKARELRA